MENEILLDVKNITKRFGPIAALKEVNFQVRKGEIHVLCGENGAGKSTLMNILSGVYPFGTYEGSFSFEGKECHFKNVRESEETGIAIIHQQLALVPQLSIAENIFAGNERASKGIVDWNETNVQAKKIMDRVGLTDDPETRVADIGVGKQQLVEISKAISKNAKLLILDEPTAALNDEESQKLLKLIRVLQSEGLTAIFITHKLREISYVCDRLTILRDGQSVGMIDTATEELTEDKIIKAMIGRDLVNRFPARTPNLGDVLLEVKHWNVYSPLDENKQIIKDVSFNVRHGEVLGIAGLMGAGRTELAMSLFGRSYGKKISGEVFKNGKPVDISTVRKAINQKVAYVSEDRHIYGYVPNQSITRNITLPSIERFVHGSVLDQNEETIEAGKYKKLLNIKCRDVDQEVAALSGGNQQKVVLSKWLMSEADVLIVDEPTRGIDVGAKYEIYEIINQIVERGKSVIFISSDMVEILGMCDRVYVLNEGEVCGELHGSDITQYNIMKCIMERGA